MVSEQLRYFVTLEKEEPGVTKKTNDILIKRREKQYAMYYSISALPTNYLVYYYFLFVQPGDILLHFLLIMLSKIMG